MLLSSDHHRTRMLHNVYWWLHVYPMNATRKPSWRKGYARQRRHSKMAVSRHLGYYRTGNSSIRSADPENPCLEPNMEWIGCTVCEIFDFKLYCDIETGVRGHSRSSKVALFDRARTILYLSCIVTIPLPIVPFPRYSRILVENSYPLVFGAPFSCEAVRFTQLLSVPKN